MLLGCMLLSKPPRDLSGPHHGGMVLNYARQALRPIGCALGHYNFISESTTRPRPPRCSASARRCTLAHPTPQAQSDFPISPRARSRLPGAYQCHHHAEGFAGAAAGPRRPPTTSPQNAPIFQHRRPPTIEMHNSLIRATRKAIWKLALTKNSCL